MRRFKVAIDPSAAQAGDFGVVYSPRSTRPQAHTLAVGQDIVIIDRANGWLKGVRTVVSPNCDERPRDGDLSLIVIHGISLPQGQFGGAWIDRFFLNELPAEADPYFATIHALKVSAHVLIDRGGNLTQYVAFNHRAWHAGKSEYCGRTACNDFSVGIELEGTDDLPYQPEQYESLARLIRSLRQAYPSLRDAAIVGHSDISPGRKTDPGLSFDWQHLRSLLADPAALR